MRRFRTIAAASALLFACSAAARAQEPEEPTSPAIALPAPGSPASAGIGSERPFGGDAGLFTPGARARYSPDLSVARAAPRLDAVGYRPRHRGYSGGYVQSSPAQIHVGFFEPNGRGATSFAIGLRGGPAIDEHIQLGFGADWYRKTESRLDIVGQSFQGGQPVTVKRVLARTSSNLLPFQAFLQVSGGSELSVIPYFGVAGQYQVLRLSATDYQTGSDFDATFGGWGWQVWGGAALALSGRSRMFGEVFVNTGDVERDVDDPSSGLTYRESVDSDGIGMRFGLSWGF